MAFAVASSDQKIWCDPQLIVLSSVVLAPFNPLKCQGGQVKPLELRNVGSRDEVYRPEHDKESRMRRIGGRPDRLVSQDITVESNVPGVS